MKKLSLFLLLLSISFFSLAQETSKELQEVIVQSFEKKRSVFTSPDALQYIDSARLKLHNNTSFVPILNSTAGIRMEERSPGSYRIAIRGSALRSPFGVRNTKIYWNQIPLTDAGNNTYFQLFDPDIYQQMLVIKGPSGGLYGAGTGGTLLLQSPNIIQNSITNQHLYNSLGGYKQIWDIQIAKSAQTHHRIYASYWNQNGFREQSDLQKTFLHYQLQHQFGKQGEVNFMSYYGDLSYETPGGLTLAQYQANPQQARPAAGAFKSAVAQKATFYLTSFQAALSVSNQWNSHWAYKWSIGTQQNNITNPTIRNYEIRKEPNWNSRGLIQYKWMGDWGTYSADLGYEWLGGSFNSSTYQNNLGEKGNLQIEQNAKINQYTVFFQNDFQTKNNWSFTLAGSLNSLKTGISNTESIFSPRLAIVKKLNPHHSLMAKIAHGFSPPSIAEIRPSTSVLNPDLKAEKGWNHEVSYRGKYTKFQWDVTAYWFELSETISLRRTADGADYFVNVGNTRQKGLEVSLDYQPHPSLAIHSATTVQDFKFVNYTAGSNTFSGNRLTGTPPFIQSFYVQLAVHKNLQFIPQFTYTDPLFLNDANTDKLPAARYWNAKMQYSKKFKRIHASLWLNLDNLLNERYVSGPDLNAVGNRYYNVSAGRNISLGTSIRW